MFFKLLKPSIHFPREIEIHYDEETIELVKEQLKSENRKGNTTLNMFAEVLSEKSDLYYNGIYAYQKGSRPYLCSGFLVYAHREMDVIEHLKKNFKEFFNKCGKNCTVDVEDETSIIFKLE